MTAYLSIEQVMALHDAQIGEYGGAHGLREKSGRESAIARPQMTFGGEDLYPEITDNAAALVAFAGDEPPVLGWEQANRGDGR